MVEQVWKNITHKRPISISIAVKVEKGGKVNDVVDQVLGLLHHATQDMGYIDEGEQER